MGEQYSHRAYPTPTGMRFGRMRSGGVTHRIGKLWSMDKDTAEYLLSMASSYAAVGTGLLEQLEDTVQSGSVCGTLRCLRDYGYFELSPTGSVVGLTPQGFELLRELRARRRTAQRLHRLNGRSSQQAATAPMWASGRVGMSEP
jgi:hypothetical protein